MSPGRFAVLASALRMSFAIPRSLNSKDSLEGLREYFSALRVSLKVSCYNLGTQSAHVQLRSGQSLFWPCMIPL